VTNSCKNLALSPKVISTISWREDMARECQMYLLILCCKYAPMWTAAVFKLLGSIAFCKLWEEKETFKWHFQLTNPFGMYVMVNTRLRVWQASMAQAILLPGFRLNNSEH